MVHKFDEENAENTMGETSEFQSNNLDEALINLVKDRPALYDIRIPQKDRTKLMKQALWYDISRCMNGQLKPDAAEIRWKYLRENYLKARKKQKIKEDIARQNGIPVPAFGKRKYSFRYYEIMQFLDDALDYQKLITMNNTAKAKSQINQKVQVTSKFHVNPLIQIPPFQVQELQQVEHVQQMENVNTISNTESYENVPSDTQDASPPSPLTLQNSELENSCNIKSNYNFNSYDQIFLECLQKPIEKPSPIDGFLIRLGEGLKRLPYRERSKLELEFLTRLHEVEEQLEQHDENID